MKEEWRDIKGYEGMYQVSNLGRVKSLERVVSYLRDGERRYHRVEGKIKVPSKKLNKKHHTPYLSLRLYTNNNGKNCYVHRLVAEAFIENSDNKPTVNHINGDKLDNRVENLEWATHLENNTHAIETGLLDKREAAVKVMFANGSRVAKCDEEGTVLAIYSSMREAERENNMANGAVSLGIRNGWRYGGYTWKIA